jgi:hypothetical protein
MKTMRSPDYTYKSVDVAIKEWYELFEPMQKLGFIVRAYDPGVSFSPINGRESLNISVHDLKIINKAIKTEII